METQDCGWMCRYLRPTKMFSFLGTLLDPFLWGSLGFMGWVQKVFFIVVSYSKHLTQSIWKNCPCVCIETSLISTLTKNKETMVHTLGAVVALARAAHWLIVRSRTSYVLPKNVGVAMK